MTLGLLPAVVPASRSGDRRYKLDRLLSRLGSSAPERSFRHPQARPAQLGGQPTSHADRVGRSKLIQQRGAHQRCSEKLALQTLRALQVLAEGSADELEDRGLIHSAHRGGDRRPRSLDLTSQGAALASKVEAMVASREQILSEVLGQPRRAALAEALGVLEDHLGLPAGAAREQPSDLALSQWRIEAGVGDTGSQDHQKPPVPTTTIKRSSRPRRLRKELT